MKSRQSQKSTRKGRGTIRSYTLALCPNPGKAEETRYALWWYQRLMLEYVQHLYSQPAQAFVRTAGKGLLANQAQKRARDLLRAGRAAERATGMPFRCPQSFPLLCDGIIQEAKYTIFDYWVKTPLGPWLPAQTHKAFKNALRKGGKLRRACEVRQGKRGGLVVRCFVEFAKPQAVDTGDCLGCDVGVNVAVARSDGYISPSLRPVMQRARAKRAEQQRQGHRCTSAHSTMKQVLDREARRVVTLAQRGSKTLVVERPKTLANLKPTGTTGGWARRHFGARIRQIAEIAGVAVREEWPAYTSTTCLKCNHADPNNRRGAVFVCQQCGARAHADVLAARNLVRRATGAFPHVRGREKAGIQTRSEGRDKTS